MSHTWYSLYLLFIAIYSFFEYFNKNKPNTELELFNYVDKKIFLLSLPTILISYVTLQFLIDKNLLFAFDFILNTFCFTLLIFTYQMIIQQNEMSIEEKYKYQFVTFNFQLMLQFLNIPIFFITEKLS